MKTTTMKQFGFTLLEMLLVLVIMGVIVAGLVNYTTQRGDELRRDKTVLQMQQILNAGMAYYVTQSQWPKDIAALQTANFLPSGVSIVNPWGTEYAVSNDPKTGNFYVCTQVSAGSQDTATALANQISGRLPLAYVVDGQSDALTTCVMTGAAACSGATCGVVASVTIPGQNLNNARSVNFASVYRHGACVPVPSCPLNMTPEIQAIPVSASGLNDASSGKIWSLLSFTAFATDASTDFIGGVPAPSSCATFHTNSPTPQACEPGSTGSIDPNTSYFRVCMDIQTENGSVMATGPLEAATILAITRCVPKNEPVGSDFSVFQP